MGIQASAGEACRPTENSSKLNFFLFGGNNFGLPGSGSTNSFESGSNQEPDPKHDHGSSLGIGSSASSLRQYAQPRMHLSLPNLITTINHFITSHTSLLLFLLFNPLGLAYVRASNGLKLCLLL